MNGKFKRRRKMAQQILDLGNSARDLCEIKRGAVMVPLFYIKSGNCLSMIEQLQNPKEEVNYYE